MRVCASLLALVLLCTSCASTSGGIAPSTIPLEPGSYDALGPVRGKSCVWYILGLIPVTGGNRTSLAIAKALARRPGATALIGVTSDTYSQFFVVVTRTCTDVAGTAVSVR